MYKRVIVTGSLAFDHIMSMPGRFAEHILPDKLHILNVSFIMSTFRQEFGGTGGNIAYTLGLLNSPCVLVGAAGKDFTQYRKHLTKIKNIDISGVKIFKDEVSARGFVTTDKDDNQIWGFYEGVMKLSKTLSLKKVIKKDDLVMIAPNDPAAMMKYVEESTALNVFYIFDPAFNIPHFNIIKFKKAVKNAHILIGNDYEIELIKRRLGWTYSQLRKNVNIVVVTYGAKGAVIYKGSKKIVIPPAKPVCTSDPTGAGDAFRAGFLAGYMRKFSLAVCGKMGALAAVYTVEKYGTQTHNFKVNQFIKRYRENFGADLKINLL
jgi:adenosine kinase